MWLTEEEREGDRGTTDRWRSARERESLFVFVFSGVAREKTNTVVHGGAWL